MTKECIVYPTSRCIREAVAESTESFLPHYMSMGEFLSRAYVAVGKTIPDEDLRLLAMHEASDFSAFAALNIERNFFSFIQNSEYLFRFFEELSSEQVSVETLQAVDVYGEYEEHIAILMRLRERYGEICDREGWAIAGHTSHCGIHRAICQYQRSGHYREQQSQSALQHGIAKQ